MQSILDVFAFLAGKGRLLLTSALDESLAECVGGLLDFSCLAALGRLLLFNDMLAEPVAKGEATLPMVTMVFQIVISQVADVPV
jgi:hypothetical protein